MTVYAANIQRAITRIKAKGMLVYYTQVPDAFVANDPAQPWKTGPFTAPIDVGLNNLVNATLGDDPTQLETVPPDPNARKAPVTCSMVMLDAKARGSSTQGMVAEFLNRTDIPAGNKLGLMAGGQGLSVKIGDLVDCNVAPNSGFPLYKVVKFKSLAPDGTTDPLRIGVRAVTPIEARDELYGMLDAAIIAGVAAEIVDAFEMRWPGVSKPLTPPPTDGHYGHPQLTTIRDEQSSLAKNQGMSRYEAQQQLLVQVHSPISVAGASDDGLLLATAIRDAFRKPSTSGLISFTNQQVRPVGNNDTHYIINVIVTCTYDNIQ